MLNGLDLFTGIGGITIALKEWVIPVAYCESEEYAIGVLLSRMQEGKLPVAPIWDDVRTLKGARFNGLVDIVYGGFPCQDISCAGFGKGLEGKRSGLFFEIVRLVSEIRPRFVFLENVPAIRYRGADVVAKELVRLGYDCRWTTLSAAAVGANHKRERWFFLAHAVVERAQSRTRQSRPSSENIPNATRKLLNGSGKKRNGRAKSSNGNWWSVEPNVGRVAHGIPNRVDKLKCLGNAVVPEQAKEAFKKLMGVC